MKRIFGSLLLVLMVLVANAQQQKQISLENFNTISVGWAFEVELKESNRNHLSIDAPSELIEKIEVKVSNNRLSISFADKIWKNTKNEHVKLIIEYQKINKLDISGAAIVKSSNTVKASQFDLEVSGAAKVDLSIKVDQLNLDLSGASNVELTGQAQQQKIKMSGASKYAGKELVSDNVKISASGAASAKLMAKKQLDAQASGAGNVRYFGNPDKTHVDVSGAGNVNKG